MLKTYRSLLALVLFLALSVPSAAATPAGQAADAAWIANYWNNTSFQGPPALQRNEANLDHAWGSGSPAPGVQADRFSARWTRYVSFAAGTYRFYATSDDGIRVWVAGQLVIDDWSDHSARTVHVDKQLDAGSHLVVVDYYENMGDAVARVSWEPVSGIAHWKGEYFPNVSLAGSPTVVRDDPQVNFFWGEASPASGIPADNFSVRWTRNVDLSAGTYRFTVRADDGVRLWVNNGLVIDAWKDQSATTYVADVYVPGGTVSLRLEYYERGGVAVAELSWSTPGSPGGTVIVDDVDAGFVQGGAAAGWRTVAEGYNGRLTWTKNNDVIRANYNWARWYPNLQPGRYEVFVYIPERYSTTGQARYWVAHAGGFALRIVNQSATGSQWVSLGTYNFRGTNTDYVSLADVTYETRVSRLIAFDAVKWEPR